MRFEILLPSCGFRRERCAAVPWSDASSCAVAPCSDLCRSRVLESIVLFNSVGASRPRSTRTPVTIHSWPCLENLILFGLMENPSIRTILIAIFLSRHTRSGPDMVMSSRYCVKCAPCRDASRASRRRVSSWLEYNYRLFGFGLYFMPTDLILEIGRGHTARGTTDEHG